MNFRKQIRLKEYDYSQNGAYFVTICTKNREHLFGTIGVFVRRGGVLPLLDDFKPHITLSPIGEICYEQIPMLEDRFNIKIPKHIVMPNHIHMIISIDNDRDQQSQSPTIFDIICAYKSITTKLSNRYDNVRGRQIWQRSFHDHVIRNQTSYDEIWNYIDTNPLSWHEDIYYTK